MTNKIMTMICWIILCLLVAGFGLTYFQRVFIYFPDINKPSPEEWGLQMMQVVHFKTQDKLDLYGWYAKANQDQPTLIYFTGNAGHIGMRAPLVKKFLQQGYGLLLVSYRGYGGAPGQPSETGFYKDAAAAIQFVRQQAIPWRDIVLYGESIGSAVSVESASHYPVAALILQSPFTSLKAIAHYHYPFLPVDLLLRESYLSIEKMTSLSMPILILHGEQDTIVPASHGQALYQVSKSPHKKLVIYPGYHHNDLDSNQISQDVTDFLKRERREP